MYGKILVPVDGSPTSQQGMDEAIKLAKLTGGSLRLVHIVDDLPFVGGLDVYAGFAVQLITAQKDAGEKLLLAARTKVEAAGIAVDTVLVDRPAGRVADRVVEQARQWGAQLIVIGTHGRRGVDRVMLGSDAEQIARSAPAPVLLVRSQATG